VLAAIGATKLTKIEKENLGILQFRKRFRGKHDEEFTVRGLWLYRELIEGVGLLPPRPAPAETTPAVPGWRDDDGAEVIGPHKKGATQLELTLIWRAPR
jgi:hypothetical protein